MIYSSLGGGLGNLLFEIAAGASHAKRMGVPCKAFYGLDDACRDVMKNYYPTILRKISFCENWPEGYEEWCPDFRKPYVPILENKDMLLGGNFQSYQYIDEPYVRELFEIDPATEAYIDNKYADILALNPVSIHVRRGDYISLEQAGNYTRCSMHYYRKAMEYIGKDNYFLVFSNDIPWCKKHFKGERILFSDRKSAVVDLYLQSKCRHHIIANSTFSWWGAWLDPKPNKQVVYPGPWYGYRLHKVIDVSSLFPESWTCVDVYPNRFSALYYRIGQMRTCYVKRICRKMKKLLHIK